eukprot:gene13061-27563_t
MGNEIGKTSSRMGIAAMAAVTAIDKNEMTIMQKKFREASQRSGNAEMISRTDFDEIIQSIETIESSDAELLDRLFTMFDTSGDNQIDYRDFIVGISPLITGTPIDKLKFAFQMYDIDNVGSILLGEMKRILTAINNVASYFGDPVITPEQIEEVAIDIFKKNTNAAAPLKYNDYLNPMIEHTIIVQFVAGRGTERFGR